MKFASITFKLLRLKTQLQDSTIFRYHSFTAKKEKGFQISSLTLQNNQYQDGGKTCILQTSGATGNLNHFKVTS